MVGGQYKASKTAHYKSSNAEHEVKAHARHRRLSAIEAAESNKRVSEQDDSLKAQDSPD